MFTLLIIVAIRVFHVAQGQLSVDCLQLLLDHGLAVVFQPGLHLLGIHVAGALGRLLRGGHLVLSKGLFESGLCIL